MAQWLWPLQDVFCATQLFFQWRCTTWILKAFVRCGSSPPVKWWKEQCSVSWLHSSMQALRPFLRAFLHPRRRRVGKDSGIGWSRDFETPRKVRDEELKENSRTYQQSRHFSPICRSCPHSNRTTTSLKKRKSNLFHRIFLSVWRSRDQPMPGLFPPALSSVE